MASRSQPESTLEPGKPNMGSRRSADNRSLKRSSDATFDQIRFDSNAHHRSPPAIPSNPSRKQKQKVKKPTLRKIEKTFQGYTYANNIRMDKDKSLVAMNQQRLLCGKSSHLLNHEFHQLSTIPEGEEDDGNSPEFTSGDEDDEGRSKFVRSQAPSPESLNDKETAN